MSLLVEIQGQNHHMGLGKNSKFNHDGESSNLKGNRSGAQLCTLYTNKVALRTQLFIYIWPRSER